MGGRVGGHVGGPVGVGRVVGRGGLLALLDEVGQQVQAAPVRTGVVILGGGMMGVVVVGVVWMWVAGRDVAEPGHRALLLGGSTSRTPPRALEVETGVQEGGGSRRVPEELWRGEGVSYGQAGANVANLQATVKKQVSPKCRELVQVQIYSVFYVKSHRKRHIHGFQ